MNVPTKQEDGDDRRTRQHRVGETESTQQDAFSRYSSNLLRMKVLLLHLEDDEGDDDLEAVAKINETFASAGLSHVLDINRHGHGNADHASSKRQRGDNSRPIQRGHIRKTRLTWELHPSLLLNDLLSQLDLAESTQAISDDEEEPEAQPSPGQS